MSPITTRLRLTRSQILAFRRRSGALDERLPSGRRSLRRAAWAGLQDSMPRAALLSIHARVAGTAATVLDDAALAQVWGPRYSVYVVAARDRAVFTLGRLPDDPSRQSRATDLADRLQAALGDRAVSLGEAGRALGEPPNRLRYASATGRLVIRWDGARQPTVAMAPPPVIEAAAARRELARRYLHVFAPATAGDFARWAGIPPSAAADAFTAVRRNLTPVATPIGDGWILARDEASLRAEATDPAPARLLPSGDAYYLLQGRQRELLVPDAARRDALWTPRVWPGAVLVAGDIVGVWRRTGGALTVEPWRRFSRAARRAVGAEAESLPLPGLDGDVSVTWA